MKKCKVKGCDKKQWAKGYCAAHYYRVRRGCPLILKCKWCKKELGLGKGYFCSNKHRAKFKYHNQGGREYRKENYTNIPYFGKRTKGKQIRVYTNGVTEEIKPLVEKITNDVLEDCIKNPRKFLNTSNTEGENE